MLLQQVMIGLVLGFVVTIVFSAIEMAGDFIGLQMGLSFATFVDPQTSGQTPLVGSFLGILAALVFLTIDGHLLLIAAIVDSFQVLPIGTDMGGIFNQDDLLRWGSDMFRIGLHLALPPLAAILLSNLALGVLTRSAPQLNLSLSDFL